ncbi:MAG TPA: hypothetical protein VGX78_03275 [Pirellulales bacterium]|nr:hypothetical protein [Pirellulales bacterium]
MSLEAFGCNSSPLFLIQERITIWPSESSTFGIGLALRKLGPITINGVIVPTAAADIELDGKILSNPDGIVVYPDNIPFAPRLPVLGLRTLVRNNVEVVIRGKDVTITP